jgi:hypothetical protein
MTVEKFVARYEKLAPVTQEQTVNTLCKFIHEQLGMPVEILALEPIEELYTQFRRLKDKLEEQKFAPPPAPAPAPAPARARRTAKAADPETSSTTSSKSSTSKKGFKMGMPSRKDVLAMDKPTPADYRLKPEQIDNTVCMRRWYTDWTDKRWSPQVWGEYQCGSPATRTVGDKHICESCFRTYTTVSSETHTESELSKLEWFGFIGDALPAYMHVPGSAWSKKCRWMGELSEVDKAKAADKEKAKAEREAEKAAVKAESARLTAEARAIKAKRRLINQGKVAVGGAGAASPPPAPVRATVAELTGGPEEVIMMTFQDVDYDVRRSADGHHYVYEWATTTGGWGKYLGKGEMTRDQNNALELMGIDTTVEEAMDLKAARTC